MNVGKRPRDDPIDTINNVYCKIPRLDSGNVASFKRVWNELNTIVETLVTVDDGAINSTEIHDLLMIISSNPSKLRFFDDEYGSQNVELAINKTTRILSPDGTIDENLYNFLWNERDEMMRLLDMSNVKKGSVCSAWRGIKRVSQILHNSNTFHIPEYQKNEFELQESQLLILMSVDPDFLRSHELSVEIGQSKCEIGILQCKHMLERTMKSCPQTKAIEHFRAKRNKKILAHGTTHMIRHIKNYDSIFKKVRAIVEKYWNEKSNRQLDALSVLFIMEPALVHSKFLLTEIGYCSDESLATVEDEVTACLKQSIYKAIDSKNTSAAEFIKDSKSIVGIGPVSPIISHLEIPLTTKQSKKLRKQLRQKVKKQLHPKILDIDGKYFVCSNAAALEWLKAILIERNEFWKTVITITTSVNQYFGVTMLSQLRLRKPFATYMKSIKEKYPNLRTELWTYLESESDWIMYVKMDIDSIAELEQRKRCIQVNEYILKFEMFYTIKCEENVF